MNEDIIKQEDKAMQAFLDILNEIMESSEPKYYFKISNEKTATEVEFAVKSVNYRINKNQFFCPRSKRYKELSCLTLNLYYDAGVVRVAGLFNFSKTSKGFKAYDDFDYVCNIEVRKINDEGSKDQIPSAQKTNYSTKVFYRNDDSLVELIERVKLDNACEKIVVMDKQHKQFDITLEKTQTNKWTSSPRHDIVIEEDDYVVVFYQACMVKAMQKAKDEFENLHQYYSNYYDEEELFKLVKNDLNIFSLQELMQVNKPDDFIINYIIKLNEKSKDKGKNHLSSFFMTYLQACYWLNYAFEIDMSLIKTKKKEMVQRINITNNSSLYFSFVRLTKMFDVFVDTCKHFNLQEHEAKDLFMETIYHEALNIEMISSSLLEYFKTVPFKKVI